MAQEVSRPDPRSHAVAVHYGVGGVAFIPYSFGGCSIVGGTAAVVLSPCLWLISGRKPSGGGWVGAGAGSPGLT